MLISESLLELKERAIKELIYETKNQLALISKYSTLFLVGIFKDI